MPLAEGFPLLEIYFCVCTDGGGGQKLNYAQLQIFYRARTCVREPQMVCPDLLREGWLCKVVCGSWSYRCEYRFFLVEAVEKGLFFWFLLVLCDIFGEKWGFCEKRHSVQGWECLPIWCCP